MRFSKELKLPAQFIEWDREAIITISKAVWHSVGHDIGREGINISDYVGDLLPNQLGASSEYHCIVPIDYAMVARDMFKSNRMDDAEVFYSCPNAVKKFHACDTLIAEDVFSALTGWESEDVPAVSRLHRWAQSVAYMAMKSYAERGKLR